MDSCKMRLCLDVMEEMGLVKKTYDGKIHTIEFLVPEERVDIENSALLTNLRRDNI